MIKRIGGLMLLLALVITGAACNSASEQGTVLVETKWGKVQEVHWPGHFFVCASPGCDYHEVDLRDHMDGVDCAGVTKDNISFYMKVDVVYKPMSDRISEYISLFGAENDGHERDSKRWNVLKQHVMNSCRNATSGKYDAYQLRAQQSTILADMYNELVPKLSNEMALHLSSVGMEIQPQFNDQRIDDAANAVVAAQKQKEAETALKNAAEEKAKRQQFEAQIYANPAALRIEELKLMLQLEQARADGIKGHQGTLILNYGGNSNPMQLQLPLAGGSK